MKYRRFSRQREQSNDVETHRCWFAGDNHLRHLLAAWRAVRDPGRAERRLNCRGYRWAPADADELCRRRAENRTTLCSRRLLLLGLGLPGAIFAERNNREPVVADYRQTSYRTWQERIRDPSLVHSADGWRAVLEPLIVRYRGIVKRLYFRGDAAFANPEIYEFLEAEGAGYTIRLRTRSCRFNPPIAFS